MIYSDRHKIQIWTDGSCTTKGRKEGGIGIFVKSVDFEITFCKGYWNTTTSRMEMKALLEAVKMVDNSLKTDVTVVSDSQFVVNSFKLGWLKEWRMNGWAGVKNSDLWIEILKTIESKRNMNFSIRWQSGHAKDLTDENIYGNNIADALADFKIQDSYEQDLPLQGFSWFYHSESDCIFVEKTNLHEDMCRSEEVLNLGVCKIANSEEAFDILKDTHLFNDFLENKIEIVYEIENI